MGPILLHSGMRKLLVTQHPCMCTLQRILKLEYELPPRIAVSPEAHSLLAAMLVAQPEQRISIQQASLRCLAGGNTSTLGIGVHPAVTPMLRSIGVLAHGTQPWMLQTAALKHG